MKILSLFPKVPEKKKKSLTYFSFPSFNNRAPSFFFFFLVCVLCSFSFFFFSFFLFFCFRVAQFTMSINQYDVARFVQEVGSVFETHWDLNQFQRELNAYANFFDQSDFDDNSEFIDGLTTRLRSSYETFSLEEGDIRQLEGIHQKIRDNSQLLSSKLQTIPPAQEKKRKEVIALSQEGSHEEIKQFMLFHQEERRKLDEEFKEVESQLKEAEEELQVRLKKEKEFWEREHAQIFKRNQESVQEFSERYKYLHDLWVKEQKEEASKHLTPQLEES